MAQGMLATDYNYSRTLGRPDDKPAPKRTIRPVVVSVRREGSAKETSIERAVKEYFTEASVVTTEGEVARIRIAPEEMYNLLVLSNLSSEELDTLTSGPSGFRQVALRTLGDGRRGKQVFFKGKGGN